MSINKIIEIIYCLVTILFIGNMLFGLYWKIRADHSGDTKIISHTFKGIFYSDRIITLPTIIVITFLNYFINTNKVLPIVSLNVLVLVPLLFSFGVLIFIFKVNPIRQKLFLLAYNSTRDSEFDNELYKRLSTQWAFWGILESFPIMSILVMSIVL